MIRSVQFLIMIILALWSSGSVAINGGASASSDIASHTVMIVSSRGSYCTGAVLSRTLVLTAAHCVQRGGDYAIETNGAVIQVTRIIVHPKYDPNQFITRKPSPDMAILKLSEQLPARYRPAKLSHETALPKPKTLYVLAGFGFARDGDERSLGTLRSVALPAVGTTGGIMVRVSAGNGEIKGACTGDSGGPAFLGAELAGIIGWTSIPAGKNCGFTTGVTLVGLQRSWLVQTIRILSSD